MKTATDLRKQTSMDNNPDVIKVQCMIETAVEAFALLGKFEYNYCEYIDEVIREYIINWLISLGYKVKYHPADVEERFSNDYITIKW